MLNHVLYCTVVMNIQATCQVCLKINLYHSRDDASFLKRARAHKQNLLGKVPLYEEIVLFYWHISGGTKALTTAWMTRGNRGNRLILDT